MRLVGCNYISQSGVYHSRKEEVVRPQLVPGILELVISVFQEIVNCVSRQDVGISYLLHFECNMAHRPKDFLGARHCIFNQSGYCFSLTSCVRVLAHYTLRI